MKVVVTTIHRGVFYGELISNGGDSCKLGEARNCVYWPEGNKGFLGLASIGPQKGARVTSVAVPSLTLLGVTSISECTPEAVEKWESAPWS